MQCEPDSNPELQELLARLARFLSANESRISAAQVSRCFQHLSTIEIAALHRLFFFLHQRKLGLSWTDLVLHSPVGRAHQLRPRNLPPPRQYRHPRRDDDGSGTATHPSQEHWSSSSSSSLYGSREAAPRLPQDTCTDTILATSTSENNRWNTPNTTITDLPYEAAQAHPPIFNVNADLTSATSHQHDMTVDQVRASDDSSGNTRLSTCIEIKLTPSTERLLENCKTDPAEFLRAIRAAKVVLPAGQGWEAAIATKKDNTDIRDLLRIYHRFECYNLYSHVVEAGFHTGTHWVRDRRSELIKSLCHDFPGRFQNERAANKCLNWVDHGCKYYEWTKMFSDPENLGYLIALPSELPHSSYVSILGYSLSV